MSEWKEVRLGDFALVKGGKRLPKGKILTTKKNSHPYIRIRDLGQEKVLEINDTYEYVDDETQQAISRYIVSTNDILISIVGTIGLVAIVGKSLDNANLTENCVKLVNIEDVDKEYLYYFLVSKSGQDAIKNEVVGAVQQKLPIKNIQNIKVPLPPLTEQHRIASILSSLDSKIENNRKICANLEAQAQALFKHWFIDFAPFKDGKFVESELGMIPEGWRVGTLGDVSSFISRGLSPKYQPGTNEMVLGQTCVRNNIVTLDNAREHNPKQNTDKRVQKWDVLLNSTGIGSLGRVGVVYFDDNNVCFDSHLTVVRSRQESFRYYLGRNLLSRQKEIENMAVGSTGQTELPKKDVLVMPILIPSDCSLASFNVLIDNIGNEMYSLLQENRRLSSLRDTLLPKLMSGEIKV